MRARPIALKPRGRSKSAPRCATSGIRFNFQDNLVTMDRYTTVDAYAFVDIPKSVFNSVDRTRLSFRVKNLTNKLYASWGDPGYTDQVILGAPRSYEVAASFKW